MTSIFEGPPGSTPIEPDDQEQLIPTWIATQSDLNAAEQHNIALAATWVFGRAWRAEDIVTQEWLKNLHTRMLGEVWRWAGGYRSREANIGEAPTLIAVALETLLADVRAQIADDSTLAWPPDEIAIRFHHRLVSIHPFVNGNGRHARLAADVLTVSLGGQRSSWGGDFDLIESGVVRDKYIAALKAADQGVMAPLLLFARSK
jgi:Fic-DOC domain mobile mystery protein B